MAADKGTEPKFVRDLSGGGQLDNQQLKRIESNPFIVTDGSKLPPGHLTRTHLNILEKKNKRKTNAPAKQNKKSKEDRPSKNGAKQRQPVRNVAINKPIASVKQKPQPLPEAKPTANALHQDMLIIQEETLENKRTEPTETHEPPHQDPLSQAEEVKANGNAQRQDSKPNIVIETIATAEDTKQEQVSPLHAALDETPIEKSDSHHDHDHATTPQSSSCASRKMAAVGVILLLVIVFGYTYRKQIAKRLKKYQHKKQNTTLQR